ncbi:MAG: glycosyltransferase [Bdellovibrionales bacterium]|nr:glycosyltransferase [Bdellovibrionales bacterium]
MKVALVHDWLVGMRGGEAVLEAIAELYPQAELFTLVYDRNAISRPLARLKEHTSALQRLPSATRRYRHFLPFMPWAIERMDLSGFDLIVSSSHCVAKGVRKAPGAVHVSYVHAPMRYMWFRYDDYFGPGKAFWPVRLAARLLRPYLQNWDRRVSQADRVDTLVGNSRFIADRIREAYGREAEVVHPFVDLEAFRPAPAGTARRNYLMVGAFAPNKRVDLAIEAFNRLKLPLVIVGSGQDERKLRRMGGPTIDFLGSRLSRSAIADLYAKSKAFIFPGVEDFGITPLEAMASGTPVVAYAEGGVLETVTPETGVFFSEPTPESLMEAVLKIERGEVSFDPATLRARAEGFSRERFQREIKAVIERALGARTQAFSGRAALT